jgi:hypothetical protein
MNTEDSYTYGICRMQKLKGSKINVYTHIFCNAAKAIETNSHLEDKIIEAMKLAGHKLKLSEDEQAIVNKYIESDRINR